MSNISQWSSIDDNNNKIPPHGWPEHQSPSSLNNSARAMMGALRRSYLEQPYFNPGGNIQYLNENSFQVKDTAEIKHFTQFYTVGRRLKFISPSGVQYGNVGSTRYAGAVSEIKVAIDSGTVLDAQTTEIHCGLSPIDMGEVVGRLPVGMILPYTAMSLPPGFLYADGKSFDPDVYTELANLWRTGDNEYLYGQEIVGSKYWVKTPDVRGQFPRFLDMNAGIDPDGETRTIGQIQTDAIRNITGTTISSNEAAADGAFTKTSSILNHMGQWGESYRPQLQQSEFNASNVVPTADENRPTNVAFPALIVAWHGITPAENISIQDLLEAFNGMQGSINQIYDAKETALNDFNTLVQGTVDVSKETIIYATTSAVQTVNATTTEAIANVEGKTEEIRAAGDSEIARVQNAASTELASLQTYVEGFNPENFTNLDLSNVSSEGKEMIIRCNIPDYSAGIDVGFSGFVAIYDGVYIFNASPIVSSKIDIRVNGDIVVSLSSSSAYIDNRGSILIQLQKGDVLEYNGSLDQRFKYQSTFYPFKGANQ